MPCHPCSAILKHFPRDPERYPAHCEACPHCGARLIQKIQRLYPWQREKKVAQCRQVLADWTRHGHTEQLIRRLAKADAWAVADADPKGKGRG